MTQKAMIDSSWPWWAQRQGSDLETNVAATTRNPVGIVGANRVAWVDPRGRVQIDGCDFSVDWCVQPESQWRFPQTEAVVRQRLIESLPIVETIVRYEGADLVHRAYAVAGRNSQGGEGWLICEIHNTAKLPIAAAFHISGWTLDGHSSGDFSASGRYLFGNGVAIGVGERPAARFVVADALGEALRADRESADTSAGAASAGVPAAGVSAAGVSAAGASAAGVSGAGSGTARGLDTATASAASAAAIWPLITGAVIRFALPLGTPPVARADQHQQRRNWPSRLRFRGAPIESTHVADRGTSDVLEFPSTPPLELVTKGWHSHIDALASVETPDASVNELVARCIGALSLWVDSDASWNRPDDRMDALAALSLWGRPVSSDELASAFADLSDSIVAQCHFLVAASVSSLRGAITNVDEQVGLHVETALFRISKRLKRGANLTASVDEHEVVHIVDALTWCMELLVALGSDAAESVRALLASARTHRVAVGGTPAGGDHNSDPAGPDTRRLSSLVKFGASRAVQPPAAQDSGLSAAHNHGLYDSVRSIALSADACGGTPTQLHPVFDVGVVDVGSHGSGWDPTVAAGVIRLVHWAVLGGDESILVAAQIPEDWIGQNWQLSKLVHPLGTVSCAVRWHGPRPALLWEVAPWAHRSGTAFKVTSNMDPAFASTALSGETLLGAPAGLVEDAPDEGESFS